MFTQACLIRDYNKDLISKIENIGYRNYGNPFQFTDYSILYTTIDGYYVPYKVQVDSSWIDCGTNEELFLAIAALRDDDCYMQYYWFDGKLLKCKGTGSTVKMNGDYSIKLITLGNSYIDVMIGNVRKATVQELIEHFKP